MKKILALAWILALCAGLLIYSFADCNASVADTVVPAIATPDEPVESREATPDQIPQKTIQITFYNDYPVLQLIYDQLTDEFFDLTGIRVVTASSESNLEGQAPALFSVSDAPPQWPCLDLSDTVAFANLACECFTLKDGDRVLGVANQVEPFGLIYNTALLARAGYTGGDINSFNDLKNVADYIHQNREKMGFGAFAAADEKLMQAVPGEMGTLWDLYQSHQADGDLLSGGAVFGLNTLSNMELLGDCGLQLEMLPLYTGAEGEETQGVHCFIRRYWCVREDASDEEIQAALAFLSFLISPRTDGTVPVDDLQLLAPYRQAVYARNSVQQRFRSDIALGKKCVVCEPY